MDPITNEKSTQETALDKFKLIAIQSEINREKVETIQRLIKISSEIVGHTSSLGYPKNSPQLIEEITRHIALLKKQKARIETLLESFDEFGDSFNQTKIKIKDITKEAHKLGQKRDKELVLLVEYQFPYNSGSHGLDRFMSESLSCWAYHPQADNVGILVCNKDTPLTDALMMAFKQN